jgi:hypothetical protein
MVPLPRRDRQTRRCAVLCLPLLLLATLGCSLFPTPTPIAWIISTPTVAAQAELTPVPFTAPTGTPSAPSTTTPPAPTQTLAPPPATPTPEAAVERIRFAPGATQATIEGWVPADQSRRFILGIQGGQLIEISATVGATGPGLRFSVMGVDGVAVKPMGDPFIRTVVPRTQDYILELASDVGAVDATLSILIPVRVSFAPGSTSAEFSGSLPAHDARHYAIRVLGGQTLMVDTTTSQGQVILIVWGADGTVLQTDHGGFPTFEGPVPSTQDYLIAVRAVGETGATYTMRIRVPPR